MGFFNRNKQNKTAEDNSQDTADSSPVNESENNHTEPSEPEPIDTQAFVEDMRRKSEEIALSIASRFAERMDGIVEPVYPPNETGTNTFFANPRAYSGSKLTPYEQSLNDTTEKIYKMYIRWFNLSLKSDGSLSWNEFSDDVIWGSYNYVKNFDFNIYKNCQW